VGSALVAVDLGASSARVMVGRAGDGRLDLTEAHRVPVVPTRVRGTLHTDALALWRCVLDGLRAASRAAGTPASVGIDGWAVDYGLLDRLGGLLGNPVHYRDGRTAGVMERVLTTMPAAELYQVTGVQLLPINTVYQLAAELGGPRMDAAETMLLLPDLLGYWLTGSIGAEATNASTTQLYDLDLGDWAWHLIRRLGLPERLFPPLRQPGEALGELARDVRAETGLGRGVRVTTVASHDTASAVVAVPAAAEAFAYVSCGTWALVGLELDAPVRTEASRTANFTNEVGVDGTIRYLRNVSGLWLLQECLRAWDDPPLAPLLDAAAAAAPLASVIDPDASELLAPGDMPARIAAACRAAGQPEPADRPALVRCVLESLALAFRRALDDAQRTAGRAVEVVHLVGGGSRNELLCQLTADACGLPVIAGPVEAAALGNVLIQARAAGLAGDLADMRRLVAETQPLRRHRPAGRRGAWSAAAARLG
jgi:rhamnulokinase